jgi:hypothetical protein
VDGSAAAALARSAPVRDAALSPSLVPRGSRRTGTLAAAARVSLTVTLAPADAAAAAAEVRAVSTPGSPQYHHFLARGQFAARYAPSPTTAAATEDWLRGAGLSVVGRSTFAVDARGPSAVVSRALGLSLQRFALPGGGTGFAPSDAPLVPAGLVHGGVTSLQGLDTADAPRPLWGAGTGSPPDTCSGAQDGVTFQQVAHNYELDRLAADGQNASGVTVGLYELASAHAGDVAAYASCFGIADSYQSVEVDGGPSSYGPEADLDIEEMLSVAPRAHLIDYSAPLTAQGAYDLWQRIVSADAAKVVSSSWGACGYTGPTGPYTTLFEQAAAQGQSILAASGDSGSSGCYEQYGTTTLSVDYPAADSFVTGVGGTTLAADGDETTWNCQPNPACPVGASGGGRVTGSSEPAWQEHAQSSGVREVPDLSANAGTGMAAYTTGGWGSWGGTSLAAPMVAALVAERDSGCRTTTGLLNPTVYSAAGYLYGVGLDDVTAGNNAFAPGASEYPAGPGYDMATGLGTPLAPGLSCADVNGLSLPSGPAGTRLTVTGVGLERSTIRFGGTTATTISTSPTSDTVLVPAGSGTVTVSATSPLGAGDRTARFTYAATAPPPRRTVGLSYAVTTAGWYLLTNYGNIYNRGGAPWEGSPAGLDRTDIVGMAIRGTGYDVTTSQGNVYNYHAPFEGSAVSRHVDDVVGITMANNGHGYYLVTSAGNVYNYSSIFRGSPAGQHLADVVGISEQQQGRGYYLATRDGRVFAYGVADLGSPVSRGIHLDDVVAVATSRTGSGYYVVTSAGNVYNFGAQFYGSAARTRLASPVVGISVHSHSAGYSLVESDGTVLSY